MGDAEPAQRHARRDLHTGRRLDQKPLHSGHGVVVVDARRADHPDLGRGHSVRAGADGRRRLCPRHAGQWRQRIRHPARVRRGLRRGFAAALRRLERRRHRSAAHRSPGTVAVTLAVAIPVTLAIPVSITVSTSLAVTVAFAGGEPFTFSEPLSGAAWNRHAWHLSIRLHRLLGHASRWFQRSHRRGGAVARRCGSGCRHNRHGLGSGLRQLDLRTDHERRGNSAGGNRQRQCRTSRSPLSNR